MLPTANSSLDIFSYCRSGLDPKSTQKRCTTKWIPRRAWNDNRILKKISAAFLYFALSLLLATALQSAAPDEERIPLDPSNYDHLDNAFAHVLLRYFFQSSSDNEKNKEQVELFFQKLSGKSSLIRLQEMHHFGIAFHALLEESASSPTEREYLQELYRLIIEARVIPEKLPKALLIQAIKNINPTAKDLSHYSLMDLAELFKDLHGIETSKKEKFALAITGAPWPELIRGKLLGPLMGPLVVYMIGMLIGIVCYPTSQNLAATFGVPTLPALFFTLVWFSWHYERYKEEAHYKPLGW